MKKKLLASAGGLTTVALIATSIMIAAPSQAGERDVFGQCSSGNPFEFSVDRERNSVDFDFDIERATPFENWTISINQNGKRIVTERMSADEDGDVDRDYIRRSSNMNQVDTWVFSARSASGKTCKATVRN
jgi:hypothetical protein